MMQVRRLAAADAADFRVLRLEALRLHPDAFGSTLSDHDTRPLEDFTAWIESAHIFGLFDGTALAGIAALSRERGGNTRHRGGVTTVYVQQAARGNGDRLMAAIAAAGRDMGLVQIELSVAVDNAPAIRTYERAGYRVFATVPRALCSRGRFIDEHLMVLDLDDGSS